MHARPRRARALAAILLATLALPAAAARTKGTGSGRSSATPPPTKDTGHAYERALRPERPPVFDPALGMFGALGAARDALGPSRLGGRGEFSGAPADNAESYAGWKSGDRVRSVSANDVRAARVQQAPDLEWAGQKPQDADLPYGIRFSRDQQRRLR